VEDREYEYNDQLRSIARRAYDKLFSPNVATIVTTDTGSSPMGFPLINDVEGSAIKVPEGVEVTPSDIASFGVMDLAEPDTYRTNMQPVSMELAADSSVDLGQLLADIFGTRLARGAGVDLVSTLINASAPGKTGTTGQTATVILDDLYDLMGSIDPAYLASPKAGFMMRFSTLLAILKLKATGTGVPLVPIAHDENGNFLLLENPVFIAPSVPAMAANSKSILFGDFSKFVIRRVRDGIEVKRFGERYAELGQIAYQGFLRIKAGLASAPGADSPIKYYANSGS
jgi:HK97 family phage major capsid protein